jgi:hypothetical protein
MRSCRYEMLGFSLDWSLATPWRTSLYRVFAAVAT